MTKGKTAEGGDTGADAGAQDIPVGDESPRYTDAMGNALDPATIEAAAAVAVDVDQAPPQAKRGQRIIRYLGATDLVEYEGGIQFRPGAAVAVPSELAEELLTSPRERFEEVTELNGD